MFLAYLTQYLPTVRRSTYIHSQYQTCANNQQYTLLGWFKAFSGSAMATSRRGDEYYRSLYAKEPDFHRLALQDADFKAMWDHRYSTRACCNHQR